MPTRDILKFRQATFHPPPVFTIFTVTIIIIVNMQQNKTNQEKKYHFILESLIIYVWNQCFNRQALSAPVPLLINIIVFALC